MITSFRLHTIAVRTVALIVAAVCVFPNNGSAQNRQRPFEAVVGPGGVALDFAPDGVWRVKAAAVRAVRQGWISRGRFDMLGQAPQMAAMSGGVLTGDFRVPTIMFGFSDTDTTVLPKSPIYEEVLFGAVPYAGRPYSLTTYFDEMSNGALNMTGAASGWWLADSVSTYYTNACGAGNAINCWAGIEAFGEAYRQALAQADPTIDFGQFDNDGPDGVPNSGDDDGVVDAVQFIQPLLGGECGGSGIWAHKFNLQWAGGVFVSSDARAGGGNITVDPYVIVSGIGGAGASHCTTSLEPMPIGVIAHELGHGLGLPDLYDLTYATEGIGEWGLMGSGVYRSLNSPAHLSAWAKQEMGWVTVRELTTVGSYSLGPVVTSDTVMMFRPTGANPRGEYYLLENKQPVGSDTANMNSGPRPKGGGLLVFHVDSQQVATGSISNSVNNGSLHGVTVLEADGLRQLWGDGGFGKNRGDAGDIFPGDSNVTMIDSSTSPGLIKNSDSTSAGWTLGAILQTGDVMSFELGQGAPPVSNSFFVRASDTLALITVNGASYNRFSGIMQATDTFNIDIPSIQTTSDSLTEFTFLAWSDGGAQAHILDAASGIPDGDSVVATVSTRYRLDVTVSGSGTVVETNAITVIPSAFFDSGSNVTLVAQPGSGNVFTGWSGDASGVSHTRVLSMTAPRQVTASFLPPIVVTGVLDTLTFATVYSDTLAISGGEGAGTYSIQILSGNLPLGITATAITSGLTIQGTPAQVGQFTVTIRISSGSASHDIVLVLDVVAPAISVTGTLDTLVMGTAYADTLTITGGLGSGSYTMAITAGTLPAGVTATMLASGLSLQGIAEESGQFPLTLEISSDGLLETLQLALTVTEPVLLESDLIKHLTGVETRLTADQIRYLDLLGNKNGIFDVGDFRAWIAQQ